MFSSQPIYLESDSLSLQVSAPSGFTPIFLSSSSLASPLPSHVFYGVAFTCLPFGRSPELWRPNIVCLCPATSPHTLSPLHERLGVDMYSTRLPLPPKKLKHSRCRRRVRTAHPTVVRPTHSYPVKTETNCSTVVPVSDTGGFQPRRKGFR
jgi:hypothetical protein